MKDVVRIRTAFVSRWRLMLIAACVIALVVGISQVFASDHTTAVHVTAASAISDTNTSATTSYVTIDVHGDVKKPGVYRLPSTARVADAIEAAGGYAHAKDSQFVNAAAPLDDGAEVVVPNGEAAIPSNDGPADTNSSSASTSIASHAAPSATRNGPATPIDPNTASLESLETLPGIGPSKAQAIIDYRQQHGGIHRLNDLREVHGIGPSTLQRIAPFLQFPHP